MINRPFRKNDGRGALNPRKELRHALHRVRVWNPPRREVVNFIAQIEDGSSSDVWLVGGLQDEGSRSAIGGVVVYNLVDLPFLRRPVSSVVKS